MVRKRWQIWYSCLTDIIYFYQGLCSDISGRLSSLWSTCSLGLNHMYPKWTSSTKVKKVLALFGMHEVTIISLGGWRTCIGTHTMVKNLLVWGPLGCFDLAPPSGFAAYCFGLAAGQGIGSWAVLSCQFKPSWQEMHGSQSPPCFGHHFDKSSCVPWLYFCTLGLDNGLHGQLVWGICRLGYIHLQKFHGCSQRKMRMGKRQVLEPQTLSLISWSIFLKDISL